MSAGKPADAPDDDPAVDFAGLALGLSAVSAVGILAELARRRRRAQRIRRPGERLRLPTAAAAAVERHLRAANAEITVAGLRDALRELALQCRLLGRPLPDVELVTLNAQTADLHLGADEVDAVRPFVRLDARTWKLDPNDLVTEAQLHDVEDAFDPYPALAALGISGHSVVLANLEAAGSLTILGEPARTTPVLHALIAELGTSELASTAQLTLTACPAALVQMLDRGRVSVLEPGQVAIWAAARLHDARTVLADAGVPTVHAARTNGLADDLWAPAVLICGPEAGTRSSAAPQRGLAVVAAANEQDPVNGWTLRHVDGAWRLDPQGLELSPQQLDVATLNAVADLLDAAQQPPEAPIVETAASVAMKPARDQPTDPVGEQSAEGSTPESYNEGVPELQSLPEQRAPLATKEEETAAPRVLVLGPVEILGARDDGAPGRRRRAAELVAYLALHPGATQHQLDEALWPGCRVSRNTRNPLVSRTRQWLGSSPDGQPYLGLVADGGNYCLSPEVTSDWEEFQALAARGIAAAEEGADDLIAALELVRGRPFLGVNPAAYAWAEAETQDMISSIVDAAHALAEIAFAVGDHRRARWAAAKGLAAEPFAEILYQDAIRAAKAVGDDADVQHLVALFKRQLAELNPDDDVDNTTAALAGRSSTGM